MGYFSEIWHPSSASEALLQAVSDAEKVETMPDRYLLNMGVWLERASPTGWLGCNEEQLPQGRENVCVVCMAGARMVGMGISEHASYASPNHFWDRRTRESLYLVDAMRLGHFDPLEISKLFGVKLKVSHMGALHEATRIVDSGIEDRRREVASGRGWDGNRASWETYRRAAAVLQASGL